MLMGRIIFLQSALENLNGKSYYTFDDKNLPSCNNILVSRHKLQISPFSFVSHHSDSSHYVLSYVQMTSIQQNFVHSLMYQPCVYLYFIWHILQ
jgi:hypothetical protein